MEGLKDHGILLWGCGERGEMAMTMFPWLPVRAAVDGDPTKQGKTWHGVEVISREAYLKRYAELPVLVTPNQPEGIVTFLQQHGCHRYWVLRDILQEDGAFGLDDAEEAADATWACWKWQLMDAIHRAVAMRWHRIGKEYFEHHFLCNRHGQTKEELLNLLRHAKHPVLTASYASVRAPFLELMDAAPVFVKLGDDLPADADLLLIHGLTLSNRILQLAMQAESRGGGYRFYLQKTASYGASSQGRGHCAMPQRTPSSSTWAGSPSMQIPPRFWRIA